MAGIERDQIILGALLIRGADASVGAAWKSKIAEKDGLVRGRGLRHVRDDHRLAIQGFDGNAGTHGTIEHAGTLAGQVRLQLVGVVHADDAVGVTEKTLLIANDPEEQIAAPESGFVGKGADGLHDRAVDLGAELGLDALGFVERRQLLQQVFSAADHADLGIGCSITLILRRYPSGGRRLRLLSQASFRCLRRHAGALPAAP